MKHMHTRVKRRLGLKSTLQHSHCFGPARKRRAHTFSTEENAHAWASAKGMKQGSYTLKRVKLDKRFQIVEMQK